MSTKDKKGRSLVTATLSISALRKKGVAEVRPKSAQMRSKNWINVMLGLKHGGMIFCVCQWEK